MQLKNTNLNSDLEKNFKFLNEKYFLLFFFQYKIKHKFKFYLKKFFFEKILTFSLIKNRVVSRNEKNSEILIFFNFVTKSAK